MVQCDRRGVNCGERRRRALVGLLGGRRGGGTPSAAITMLARPVHKGRSCFGGDSFRAGTTAKALREGSRAQVA